MERDDNDSIGATDVCSTTTNDQLTNITINTIGSNDNFENTTIIDENNNNNNNNDTTSTTVLFYHGLAATNMINQHMKIKIFQGHLPPQRR